MSAEQDKTTALIDKQLSIQIEQSIISENVEKMVDDIIISAMLSDSSDIHIEAFETEVRLRFRMDGVLHAILTYPIRLHSAVISRIKILANLKIDEKRVPQDGRIDFKAYDYLEKKHNADLRVSTLPTVHGEKVVMRIANQSDDIPSHEKLGFQGNNLKFIYELMKKPNGVIVVSGPTGSGKTITLYSTLKNLNIPDTNIMTIEDPVEWEMYGLNQCQTHNDAGFTFAVGLRAALRQDPDIIMVGEIRDKETADVSMHAALTGHLVLSTIHTNSAAETITRFVNMGIPKFILGAALKGVIAQRLARKICDECREEIPSKDITDEMFEDIEKTISKIHSTQEIPEELLNPIKLYKGKGCEKCAFTGYKGRLGIMETLVVREDIVDSILAGDTVPQIEKKAVGSGMITIKQDGMLKALKGYTTIEEVYRLSNDA